jgi:parvulin-like peptidyl-prolyl isomerase
MKRILIALMAALFVVTGCTRTPTSSSPTAEPTSASTPTITPEPMALVVNGEGISMVEYNAALTRLQEAQQSIGTTATPQEQRDTLVDTFVSELLLAQAAAQSGKVVDDTELQTRVDKLAADLGGEDKLTAWQERYGYTPETFRASLRRSILVSWQRDAIIDAVPATADQVHTRQILVQDKENADAAYAMIRTGTEFATLAYDYDPSLGGDMQWFPQWGLTQQNVADAAFALQPGEYSEVIKSDIGYHIVYVIERDAQHPLSVNMRLLLQQRTLEQWLAEAKAASTIEVLVN